MEIGGYFELELPKRTEYHNDNVIRLNTGRNAFEYILRAKGYKKIYLPYYTCDSMLEPINKLTLEYEFYHIDESFKPIFDFSSIQLQEVFVYTNYFGVCDKQVSTVAKLCKNLIIDNSQAFFEMPLPGVDTFYSARKFFGVPDGAYLYTDKINELELEQDESFNRFRHLLGRIDVSAEAFYWNFKENDGSLSGQAIKRMSKLTQRMLQGVDYNSIAENRITNFRLLHKELEQFNKLKLNPKPDAVPLVYPFLCDSGLDLKDHLIANRIFTASYWPNVFSWTKKSDLEYVFAENVVNLPIDQRYNRNEMNRIIEKVRAYKHVKS